MKKFIKFYKSLNRTGRVLLALDLLIIALPLATIFSFTSKGAAEVPEQPTEITEANQPTTLAWEMVKQPEYIFMDGNGCPVNWQAITTAWASEAGIEKRYDLTDAERWEIASVITAEAGSEPYAGMVAVAQCILQACEDDNLRPSEVFTIYQYSSARPEPSEEALEAVQAVFDFGQVATADPIKYFYAPAYCESAWHESQIYVMTINGHRFFMEAE